MGFFIRPKWSRDNFQLELEETELFLGDQITGTLRLMSDVKFDVEMIWVKLRCEESIAKTKASLYDKEALVSGYIHVNAGFDRKFPFVIKLPFVGRETYHSISHNVEWLLDGYLRIEGIKNPIMADGGGFLLIAKPKASVKEPSLLCPSCSKQVKENDSFCPYCRKPLRILLQCKNAFLTNKEFHYKLFSGKIEERYWLISRMKLAVENNGSLGIIFNDGSRTEFKLSSATILQWVATINMLISKTHPTPPNTSSKHAYDVLEVPYIATRDQVTTAWKGLCNKYHPDHATKDPVTQKLYAEKFDEVNKAKEEIFKVRGWN